MKVIESMSITTPSDQLVHPEDDLSRWIADILRTPAAKPIIQHFAVFEAILGTSGKHYVEPPIDQAATWRRMFCWMYNRTDLPFGISSPITSSLPKCIAICNLSGSNAFYFCDNFNLARILCLSPQEQAPRIISGVDAVFQKARDIDSSVIVLFCLPFQSGVERCYWEVRTVRKTKCGVVKDGEMFFSVNDSQARPVPCTLDCEHWHSSMLSEMCRNFMTVVSPVCLDQQVDAQLADMSHDQALSMVNILKVERVKLLDGHKRSIAALKAQSLQEVSRLTEAANVSEKTAEIRVLEVIEASKSADGEIKQNIDKLNEHNALLIEQVNAQKILIEDVNSRMFGLTLENEQDLKDASCRQKTLESQVSLLQSSNAKQVAEQAKKHKEMVRSHEAEIRALEKSLDESRKKRDSTISAAALVTKSADYARREKAEADALLKAALEELTAAKCGIEELKQFNESAKGEIERLEIERLEVAKEKQDSPFAVDNISSAQVEDKIMANSVDTTEEINESTMVLSTELVKLKEMEVELGKKNHLLNETEKRNKFLESRMRDIEGQLIKANQQVALFTSGGKASLQKRGKVDTQLPDDKHTGHTAHATANVNQHTLYMQNSQQQHGFPTHGNFIMDPMLESMISQLYGALQTITVVARSSSSNKRAADVTQSKLDTLLATHGTGSYYDAHNQHMQFFPRR